MENKDLYSKIAAEQNIALKKVEAVVALLEEDATIPLLHDTAKKRQAAWMKCR
jgi:transcriptional accessory protein Tex/SPT6